MPQPNGLLLERQMPTGESLFFRFKAPANSKISVDRLIKLELSLLGHEKLDRYSVFPPPEVLTREQLAAEQLAAQNEHLANLRKQPVMMLDTTNPDREAALRALIVDRFAKNQGIETEMQVISTALNANSELALAWLKELAKIFENGDVSRVEAYELAAAFLNELLNVNVTDMIEYLDVVAGERSYEYSQEIYVAKDRNDFYATYFNVWLNYAQKHGVAARPTGCRLIESGTIQYPLAFRIGRNTKEPTAALAILIIADGEKVQTALDAEVAAANA